MCVCVCVSIYIDRNGELMRDNDKVKSMCREYFDDLLNPIDNREALQSYPRRKGEESEVKSSGEVSY